MSGLIHNFTIMQWQSTFRKFLYNEYKTSSWKYTGIETSKERCSVMTLEAMKNVDITKVNPDELVDIREVKVNTKLQQNHRIQDFISQIKNPYCYKYGDYIVKIGFEDTDVTITEMLRELILKTAAGM